MKHTRPDYNRIQDPGSLIPENEPVFLLRGQDLAAPKALREYAMQAHKMGAGIDVVTSTLEQARAMEAWQRTVARKVADIVKMNTHSLDGREWARISQLKDGDRVEVDDSFPCMPAGIKTVRIEDASIYVDCDEGPHELNSNATDGNNSDGDHIVGVWPAS